MAALVWAAHPSLPCPSPPLQVVEIVCCRLTPLQTELYCHFLESKATRTLFATQKAARVLSAITSLRKLLNHPKLIWDALQGRWGEWGDVAGARTARAAFVPGPEGVGLLYELCAAPSAARVCLLCPLCTGSAGMCQQHVSLGSQPACASCHCVAEQTAAAAVLVPLQRCPRRGGGQGGRGL